MSTFFPPDRIVMPRFVMRSYFPGDGAMLADAVNSSLDHLGVFLPWAEKPMALEEAEQRVRNYRARYLRQQGYAIGIFAPDESELWGGGSYNMWDVPPAWGNADIGLWMRSGQSGKGLGTEVLHALLNWGFTEWRWTRLSWTCDSTNIASRRTAERVGLQYEGTHLAYFPARGDGNKGDAMVFAMTKDVWQEAK